MTKKERQAAVEKGVQAVKPRPENESRFRRPAGELAHAGRAFFNREEDKEQTVDSLSIEQTVYPLSIEQRVDPQVEQTVDSLSIEQTVCPSNGQTPLEKKEKHRTDGQVLEDIEQTVCPLAPLQWEVWQLLQDVEGDLLSYRWLVEHSSGKLEGVKKAIRTLRMLGGIQQFTVDKSRAGQGFRVELNRKKRFQRVALDVSKGIKRSSNMGQTTDPPPSVPTRMYVCKKNTYIQEEDLASLLRMPPSKWQIREQTLVQIADAFPSMTALEFRLSLRRLIKQATTGKQTIQNPNAWIKAAFEKNGGPLMTEREIEARLDQHEAPKSEEQSTKTKEEEESRDLEVLRRYMAASPEERAQIDEMAEKRAAPLLASVAVDKHAGILEQAKVESTQKFFTIKG